MKIAPGKRVCSVSIRAVCGGDFSTSRLGFLKVTVLRKRLKVLFQRRRPAGETPSRSRYFSSRGPLLGKPIVRYGERAPSRHIANSSSCGRSQPAFMLSIGRREGIKNHSQRVTKLSVKRKSFGQRH